MERTSTCAQKHHMKRREEREKRECAQYVDIYLEREVRQIFHWHEVVKNFIPHLGQWAVDQKPITSHASRPLPVMIPKTSSICSLHESVPCHISVHKGDDTTLTATHMGTKPPFHQPSSTRTQCTHPRLSNNGHRLHSSGISPF